MRTRGIKRYAYLIKTTLSAVIGIAVFYLFICLWYGMFGA